MNGSISLPTLSLSLSLSLSPSHAAPSLSLSLRPTSEGWRAGELLVLNFLFLRLWRHSSFFFLWKSVRPRSQWIFEEPRPLKFFSSFQSKFGSNGDEKWLRNDHISVFSAFSDLIATDKTRFLSSKRDCVVNYVVNYVVTHVFVAPLSLVKTLK